MSKSDDQFLDDDTKATGDGVINLEHACATESVEINLNVKKMDEITSAQLILTATQWNDTHAEEPIDIERLQCFFAQHDLNWKNIDENYNESQFVNALHNCCNYKCAASQIWKAVIRLKEPCPGKYVWRANAVRNNTEVAYLGLDYLDAEIFEICWAQIESMSAQITSLSREVARLRNLINKYNR
eukprot:UN01052